MSIKKIYLNENQLNLLKEYSYGYQNMDEDTLSKIDSINYSIDNEEEEDEDGNLVMVNYYDIVCYDMHGDEIYSEDTLTFDDLVEYFGNEIATEISSSEKGSGSLDNLMNTKVNNLDDVDEVNALAKNTWTVVDYYGGERGYLLTDGSFIYFGPNLDHMSICWIDGMTVGKFVSLGNIRVGENGFELEKEPTLQQRRVLKQLIRNNSDDTCYVDIVSYDGKGTYSNSVTSARFQTHEPNLVLRQLDRYFEDGIKLTDTSDYDDEYMFENVDIEAKPSDVDLTSFKKQKNLNSEIWENGLLNSKIRLKLLDIADDFYSSLSIKFVKPKDIVLMGSICNYNWSEFSDIDLHILVDFKEVDENVDLVKEYFDAKKNEWNESHDGLTMYGFQVELYVQDTNEFNVSEGMYSLEKNEWLKVPQSNNIRDLDNMSQTKIKRITAKIMTKIDDWLEMPYDDEFQIRKTLEEISTLIFKLKKYRRDSLKLGGEMSIGNIVYKSLRRSGYLDDLYDLKDNLYNKINSVG